MKLHTKRWIAAGIIMMVSMQLPACGKAYNPVLLSSEIPIVTTAAETAPLPTTVEALASVESPALTEPSAPTAHSEASYDSSKTMTENLNRLNRMLDAKYQRCMTVSGAKEYEAAGKPDWTLILDGDNVGFDDASWKYDYQPDSEEAMYMDAVLTTFIFFYGEEMGDSLWRLTIDLFDDGADETQYDFRHNGGQIIYKDTRTALIGYADGDETYETIYIWMTPGVLGEYKDVID